MFPIKKPMEENLQNNFIDATMDLLESLSSCYKQLKQGKSNTNDLESLLRLAHSTEGSASRLELNELAKYCLKLETLLIEIKRSEGPPSAAQISVLLETEDILRSNLKRLRLNKKASFEATEHINKLELLLPKK